MPFSPQVRIFWRKTEGNTDISFNDVPFSVFEQRKLDCQKGDHYYKEKPPKQCEKKRLCLQGTRKSGCPAQVHIKGYLLYPEYKLQESDLKGRAKRHSQEQTLQKLYKSLEMDASKVATQKVYHVSLPTLEAHSDHVLDSTRGFSQRVHPELIHQIHELVLQGITDSNEVRRALKFHVKHHLSKIEGIQPSDSDRSYFPTSRDIQHHIYNAKKQIELSALDQENLTLKIQQWKAEKSDSLFYFRPYRVRDVENSCTRHKDATNDNATTEATANDFVETLLYVHQEQWQRDLLKRYGNNVTLLDATYKTTKYDLALFFLCVKTNVGYSVVGEFIIQSENVEQISEAIGILKNWNQEWKPMYFIVDYSEAEMQVIEESFSETKVYICDFHREQAWERWCKVIVYVLCIHIIIPKWYLIYRLERMAYLSSKCKACWSF